jgi:hypothetical protein
MKRNQNTNIGFVTIKICGIKKMRYEKLNNNPLGIKTNDCVIRSISFTLNQSWKKVYTDLFNLSMEHTRVFNDEEIIKIYLSEFEHHTCPAVKGESRKKVKDFDDNNTYILSIANHLTCVIDGTLFDTWDCRNKCVYRYWIIDNNNNNK